MYVAPPPRGSKKDPSKARETANADQVVSLEPVQDGKSQTLEQLKQTYGERLRLAVDSEVSRATLAGPHAKVCPEDFVPVYTVNIFVVHNAVPNGLHGSATHSTR